MTPNPGIKVMVLIKREYLKRQSYYRTLMGQETIGRMVPVSMNLSDL